MVPLSDETAKRVRLLFTPADRVAVAHLLANECADNLRLPSVGRDTLLERIRFSVLRLSGGDAGRLQSLIDAAKSDRRDLIKEAGFADSWTSHRAWYPASVEQARPADARKDARG